MQYPGDGKVKPIAFPDPRNVSEVENDISYVNLATLVELKLASGMSGADRFKDLGDVQELIKVLSLPRDYSQNLNEYVRPKYEELWDGIMGTGRRFVRLWRNKFLTIEAETIDDMIAILQSAAKELQEMKAAGVTLDSEGGTADDYAYLVTTDPEVARRFDMHDESEYLDSDE